MADPSDIIKQAIGNNPVQMQDSFADLMLNKIRDAIELKKAEVAQQFLGFDNIENDQSDQQDDPEDSEEMEDEIDELDDDVDDQIDDYDADDDLLDDLQGDEDEDA